MTGGRGRVGAVRRVCVTGAFGTLLLTACAGESRPATPEVASSAADGTVTGTGTGTATGAESASAAGPSTTQAFTRLDADTLVDVALADFTIQANQTTVPAGRIYLDVRNRGQEAHELVVIRAGATDEEGAIADTGTIPAGEASTLAVELAPGRYQFACYLVDAEPDGTTEDHFRQGMVLPFQVN